MTAQGALVEHEPDNRALSTAPSNAGIDLSPLVQLVAEGKIDMDQLERMISLQERHEANQAKKAFNNAMAEARKGITSARKSQKNTHINSSYADLDDVVNAARMPLAENSFNYYWTQDTISEPGFAHVTCHLEHAMGHEKTDTMRLQIPKSITSSAGKQVTNEAQNVGIIVTFGKRYTFQNLLGITSKGDDKDAQVPKPKAIPPIEEKQESILVDLLSAIEGFRPGYTKRWTDHYSGEHGTSDTPLGVSLPANRLKHVLDELNGHLRNYKAAALEAENADS